MNTNHTWQGPLNSLQLNAFVTLVQTGIFSEAGWKFFLTLSASAFSTSGLENGLGCRVLNRLSKTL